MCKAEYMSMSGHPSGKYLKRVPFVWEKKKWCIFCRKSRVSRILLPAVRSSRRVKPSPKIALNSNGEVNCRELARRPWSTFAPLLLYWTRFMFHLFHLQTYCQPMVLYQGTVFLQNLESSRSRLFHLLDKIHKVDQNHCLQNHNR